MDAGWLAPPGAAGAALFLLGWAAGWVGFLRARSLAPSTAPRRSAVSVVVPCRDEATNLAELLPNLRNLLGDDDELIVVDDDSSDETTAVAAGHGATVVSGRELPPGWAGKPHACWQGAQRAGRETLVFLDADVRLGPGAIDDLVSLLDARPDAVVSAMPWHRTGGPVERLSMLFNTVSMMVASAGGDEERRRVAYGPFLAVRRDAYFRAGGHSHPTVRGAVVEDLALARAMPAAVARVARPGQVEYRMYPLGVRHALEGWTKNTSIGAVSVPRWSAIFVVAWMVSLCGGVVTSAWCYVFSLAQVRVLARRAGNFGLVDAALYPLHAAVFVVVAVRSAVRSALVGRVTWRGRAVATR